MICKLCEKTQVFKLCENSVRKFYRCDFCELIFVPDEYHLSVVEEKVRYDLHDNSADNKGYVNYLEKVVKVVSGTVNKDKSILDFGSGKNAVLSDLFKKNGFNCTPYDPLYGLQNVALDNAFDILIACEVVEHLRDLRSELFLMKKMVADKSKIIIRTQLCPPSDRFLKWWYIQDLTHINFFSLKSLEIAGQILDCDIEQTDEKDIFVLNRK
jgi:hypothetical protein